MIYIEIVFIFILWNWGITPDWVNAVCTCLLGIGILEEVINRGEHNYGSEMD